jgi:hypothetical protein
MGNEVVWQMFGFITCTLHDWLRQYSHVVAWFISSVISILQVLILSDRVQLLDVSECKDTTVLNMYNIFNLKKRHSEWIACT